MAKTKFFKIIAGIFLCFLFAITYVHQEVEIVKTSLNVNEKRREVSFLLDQYRSLVYNLSRLESPQRIESRLSNNEIVLCMPSTNNIHRVDRINIAERNARRHVNTKESFLARVFDRLSTKAEAKDKF